MPLRTHIHDMHNFNLPDLYDVDDSSSDWRMGNYVAEVTLISAVKITPAIFQPGQK